MKTKKMISLREKAIALGMRTLDSDRILFETKRNLYPKEESEQMDLAVYLDTRGFIWCHIPNEGRFDVAYLAKRKRLGVKKGFPDNLIFRLTYRCGTGHVVVVGMAIELKRQKGGRV